MKKTLSIILAIILILGCVSISVSAAETEFTDVPASEYYCVPVQWAVSNGITNGTGENKFSPDAPCTRAQVVTFLWRAANCPESVSNANPFTDVADTVYYYDAVLWAVENGITNGTGANQFSPDETCPRGQIVTFLWRFAGSPAPLTADTNFSDVAPMEYYTSAVAWAVENGVTNGTGNGNFSPDDVCTRAQIVTFLYRAMSNAYVHNWDSGEVTKEATCTADGVKTYTCSKCGDSYTEEIAKTSHSYKTETVAPTTDSEGYDLHTCTVCGDSYKDNYTDKLPSGCTSHEYEWVCDPNYNSDTVGTCKNCGAQKVLYASQSIISSEALAILNAYREAEGLEPVVAWTKGEKVAKVRAAELTVCASHNRPDGTLGLDTCVAGGYGSAQAAIDAWMASSSHRGSLMDANATKAVIAYNGSCWVLRISS